MSKARELTQLPLAIDVNTSGDIGINTTPGNGSRVNIYYERGSKHGTCYVPDANTGVGNAILFVNASATSVGYVAISSTATSYVTSSDYRLKENITPMTGALDTIAQLNPVTYNWKADGSNGQGFIAHELQAVVPECVTGEKDAVDADNNPVYQGIDTSFLVATLTAAIKELKAEVDALKAGA